MKSLCFLKPFGEWGIGLSPIKYFLAWKNHLTWKLIMVNVVVISVVIWLAGVSVKDFACILVGQYQLVGEEKSQFFNQTMHFYLLRASVLAIIVAAVIHFFFIKRLLAPLKRLTQSAQQLMGGTYPEPIQPSSEDEIGQLTRHFNELTRTLKRTEENRKRMLSNISHDLRTPLSSLNGYLEALSNGVLEGNQELYQSLLEESLHLTRLVEQLHQLTVWEDKQKTRLTLSKIDIHELTNRCIQTFRWEYQNKEIELHVSIQADTVIGDDDGLKQVMNNLLKNALVYNTGRNVWVTGEAEDQFYRITVSNFGEPLQEDMRELVFERFFQADPSRHRGENTKGSGLGLAIVKEIVEQHGGKTGLYSESNKHYFWFTIPRCLDSQSVQEA